MSSSGPPQKIQGWAGIAIRVSFCLHRRMTCMVDKRPSRARSIFLCVGPWCIAPRGIASQAPASDAEWAVPHPLPMLSENCVHQRRRRDCRDGLSAQQKT